LYEYIISNFERDNPGIKVETVVLPIADFAGNLRNLLASGNPPDLMQQAESIASIPGVLAEVPQDIIAALNPAVLASYDGKYISVPMHKQLRTAVFYHKADFAALNLAEPQTWDEFLAVCKALKDAGKVPLMGVGGGGIEAGEMYYGAVVNPILINTYPNFLPDVKSGKLKWNNPVIIETLTTWQELIKAGYYYPGSLSLDYFSASSEFLNGKASMMFDGIWTAASLDAANNTNISSFVMPNPQNLKTYSAAYGYWGVSAQSKQKDAAFTFIKYVLTGNKDVYIKWLSSDGYTSTTLVPVDYPHGPVMTKFINDFSTWTLIPDTLWNTGDWSLPPGMQSFMNKSMTNIFSGSDVTTEVATWDGEMQNLMSLQQ
jgi:raffinose/stachyose/melibiose transport system substrate-binding protein